MEDFWILIIFSNTQYDVSGSGPLDNDIVVTVYCISEKTGQEKSNVKTWSCKSSTKKI